MFVIDCTGRVARHSAAMYGGVYGIFRRTSWRRKSTIL